MNRKPLSDVYSELIERGLSDAVAGEALTSGISTGALRIWPARAYDRQYGPSSASSCRAIRAATDERDFYAMKSLHFEKLEGNRSHERSMRINKQWRLIIELLGEAPNKKVRVTKIEDYH